METMKKMKMAGIEQCLLRPEEGRRGDNNIIIKGDKHGNYLCHTMYFHQNCIITR